jgi:hypothetical protein
MTYEELNNLPALLVSVVRQYERMDNDKRQSSVGVTLLDQVKVAGATAAYFGGFDAMEKLHNAAEGLVGEDNSVGYWLNYMWDGIGGWAA